MCSFLEGKFMRKQIKIKELANTKNHPASIRFPYPDFCCNPPPSKVIHQFSHKLFPTLLSRKKY